MKDIIIIIIAAYQIIVNKSLLESICDYFLGLTHARTQARTHAGTQARTHARTHARRQARTHARTHVERDREREREREREPCTSVQETNDCVSIRTQPGLESKAILKEPAWLTVNEWLCMSQPGLQSVSGHVGASLAYGQLVTT